MIRLILRRLIVPRGDTGTFSIPVLAGKDTGDASVFTIFNPLTHRKIFEKVMQLSDGVLTMDLTHGDTVNLPVGQFVWDIKFYTNPTIADGHLVDGEEVDSYYAAFTLPVCEIRETGDNLLMSDEAPLATLSPGQIDYITASINEVTNSKNAAASSAAEADTSAQNAETSASAAAVSEQAAQDSLEAALASQLAALTAAELAIASAEAAAETAAQIEADLESKANITDLDDVAFSGDYNDLSNTPYIPSIEGLATVLYVDEKTEKVIAHFPVHSEEELTLNLTCSHTIAELYEAYSAGKTIMGSLDFIGLETQSILMESSITFGSRPIIKFKTDMVGDADAQLVIVGGYLNNKDIWQIVQQVGLTAYKTNLMDLSLLRFTALGGIIADVGAPVNNTDVANKLYVDNSIPTNVSQLTNDAGYLTSFTETDPTVPGWAKQAQKPTYTALEVGAPTIQLMNEGLALKVESLSVELMYNTADDTITANKTIEEILNAYDAGKIVRAFLILDNLGLIPINITVSKSAMIAIYGHAIAMGSTIMIMGMNRLNVDNWAIFITESLLTDPVFSLQETSTGPYQALNKKIENLANPTNDKDAANKLYVDNKIAAFTETDPTVPAWAKASTKPAYTAAEVGAPTVLEMNNALAAKTELFTVNFTTDSEISTVTSDKTIAEIYEAHTLGKVLQGIINIVINESMPDLVIQYIGKIILMNSASTMYACICEVGTAGGSIIISGTRTGDQDSWSSKLVNNLAAVGADSDYSASNSKIINLAAPTANTDAANKKYVDDTVAAFTETDPTVPSWAKALTKPTYTASEVGAPTVAEMNTAIGAAIGNVHQFELSIVQELPTQDIDTHTIYLVPKTGDTNDVYDEYIYINNAWEMIGNTLVDLSNYVLKTDYATNESAGVVKVNGNGVAMTTGGTILIIPAPSIYIKAGTEQYTPIAPKRQHEATFYGLAKAAGDITQSVSTNAIGTYTDDAKSAILNMLGVPSTNDLNIYATKANTILENTLSLGRKENTTIGNYSVALGFNVIASGNYSFSIGGSCAATNTGTVAEGAGTTASGFVAHSAGYHTEASGYAAYAINDLSLASGTSAFSQGTHTIANGLNTFAGGQYNIECITYPVWIANTSYKIGDKITYSYSNNVIFGYECIVDNNDSSFTSSKWKLLPSNSDVYFIIGNGRFNNRSNAYALEWTGTAHYAGDVYVGCNNDSTGGTRLATITELAAKLDATEAGLKVVRLI